MKKLAFRFSILLGVIASLLCFIPNVTTKAYAAQANTQASLYLLGEDGKAYLSNVEAGEVSGYGSYAVGYKALLQASTNDGFSFVGWEIDGEIHNSSFSKVYDNTDDGVDNGEEVNYTISIGTKSSLVISKVPKDLIVRAVYDYKYYDFSLSEDIIETLALNTETIEVGGKDVVVMFPKDIVEDDKTTTFKTEANGITTYTNAIVNSKFYENLHFDGTSLYTEQEKNDGNDGTVKVDYTRGAFRLNDSYNVEFNLNLTDKMEESENYDVQSFAVNGVGATATIDKNSDAYKRTSKFSVSGTLTENSLLTWKVHMLTVVDLIPCIKTNEIVEATGEDKTIIASQVKIDNYYSFVESGRYLIKHSSHNAGNVAATIKYEQFAGKQIEGVNYYYFEIESIRNAVGTVFKPNDNKELGLVPTKKYETFKIVYTNVNFEISFEARLIDNLNEKFTDLTLNEQTQLRVRGQEYEINSEDISYAGYELQGFSTDLETIEKESLKVTIDRDRPDDIKIYLIFKKIDYVIRLNNLSSLTLLKPNQDSTTTTIYSMASVKAFKGTSETNLRQTEIYSEKQNAGSNIFKNPAYSFITTYNLDEMFKFEINANAGFKIGLSTSSTGFDVSNLDSSASLSQVLDETFLTANPSYVKVETDGTENVYVIDLYLHSDYETYTFKYKINPATHGTESVIMADISAIAPNRIGVEMVKTEEGITAPKSKVITITGVRLYDAIPLTATVLNLKGSTTEYYNFQRFISSSGIGLDGVVNHKPDFTYTYIVAGDETITAIVAAPESQLQVSIDNEDAYDISQIKVYFDKNKDGEVKFLEEDLASAENGAYMISGDIKVVLNNINIIANGYYFEGFSIKTFKDGLEASTIDYEYLDGIISFTMVSTEAHELLISCPEIQYKISATQSGAGVANSDVVFGQDDNGDDVKYINLSLSKLDLQFEFPKDGIYVSGVSVGGIDISQNFAQAYNGTKTYSKTLTKVELLNLAAHGEESATKGVVEIKLNFSYSLVTFSVSIDLLQEAATDKKTYSNINDYVNIVATYKVGDETVEIAKQNIDKSVENMIIINNIPYATEGLSISLSVVENVGLTHYKWVVLDGASVDAGSSSTIAFETELLSNKVLSYSVQYKVYQVELIYENGQGEPTVNGEKDSAYVSALDQLEINAQALKKSGYKFVAMYQKYVYNESTWEQEKTSLYIQTKNGFAKLTKNDEYNSEQTYYAQMSMSDFEPTKFVEEELLLEDYYISGDKISMLLVYEYIEVNIVNVLTLEKNSATLSAVSVEDFAEINVKSGDNIIAENEKVNFATGEVTIEVCMNDIEYNGLTINLISGVDFINANTLLGDFKSFIWKAEEKDTENNLYSFVIDISSLIPFIADDAENITITYTFVVKTFTTSITTNVPANANFYTQSVDEWGSIPAFVMTGKKDNQDFSSSFASSLDVTMNFLDKVTFSYYFSEVWGYENVFKNYFNINKLAIKVGNKTIDEIDYKDCGINILAGSPMQIETLYLIDNLQIVLQVEPIVYLNGAENGEFNKTYKFKLDQNEGTIEGVAQTISFGTTADCNVQMSEFLYEALIKDGDNIILTYTNELGNYVNEIKNVGTYVVTFYFQEDGEYGWLSELALTNQVVVKVNPLALELSQTPVTETLQKEYDGNNTISFDAVRRFVNLSGIDYEGNLKKINLATNNSFGVNCDLTTVVDESGEACSAARDIAYDISFKNLKHDNKNFTITNVETFKITKCVRITKRLLTISNIQFYDKVYDGTKVLSFSNMSDVVISGIVSNGDDVRLNFDNLIIEFEDAHIGLNKKVIVQNFEDCLIGTAKGNYLVNGDSFKITAAPSIYPYSIFANVDGYGKIEIINERGKTEQQYVSLIPIGAELKVEKIDKGGAIYADMYQTIEEYLSGNREFVVGYTLSFVSGGKSSKISNQLYLKLPSVESLRNIISVTGDQVLNLKYDISNSQALIDLSQISTDINTFVMIANRSLFKIWQIILIVGVIVLIIAIIVVTIIIVRRRKLKKYSINEKI